MKNYIYVYMLLNLVSLFLLFMLILISVAFLTLFERKLLGYIQDRKGPNKVGLLGLMQPFSDALKLLNKEFFYINNINYLYYFVSPLLLFVFSLVLWVSIPSLYELFSFKFSMIFLLMILGINIYPVMIMSWASNSNYAMLGSMRSVAQSISYEISLFLMIFIICILIESYSLSMLFFYQEIFKFVTLLFPVYLILFVSMLVELNRTPFDLVEGESELVSGFNVEYFGGSFTLIFLAEYANILFMGLFLSMLFWGVQVSGFVNLLLIMFHIMVIIWIRSLVPRIRYDILMYLCWKKFLSVSLIYMWFMFILKLIIKIYL